MTKSEMRTAIRQWTQRRNIPDATVDSFMDFSQSRANRMLRIPPLEKYVAINASSNGTFAVPDDYLEAKSLQVPYNDTLLDLDRKTMREVKKLQVEQRTDYPLFFARVDTAFEMAPWSLGEDVDINLYYYSVMPFPAGEDETNWFFSNASDLILYGALEELSKYTRDEEGQARWKAAFEQEVNTLQAVEDRAAWSGNTPSISIGGSTGKY